MPAFLDRQRELELGGSCRPAEQHVTRINSSFPALLFSKLDFIISPTCLLILGWSKKWCIQGHSLPWGQCTGSGQGMFKISTDDYHQWPSSQGPSGPSHQFNVFCVYKKNWSHSLKKSELHFEVFMSCQSNYRQCETHCGFFFFNFTKESGRDSSV